MIVGTIAKTAIHSKILVVARGRAEGTWKAYVTPVPGLNHDIEAELWQTDGAQLPEALARPIFPQFDDIPYAS